MQQTLRSRKWYDDRQKYIPSPGTTSLMSLHLTVKMSAEGAPCCLIQALSTADPTLYLRRDG